MTNAFQRSREVMRLSFSVIRADKELLWFPILSSIFSALFSIAVLFPTILIQLFQGSVNDFTWNAIYYLWLFLVYFGLAVISTFFGVCTCYTAKTRFEGGDATLGQSIKYGFKRFGSVVAWGAISGLWGVLMAVLQNIANRLGTVGKVIIQLLRGAMSFMWNIATIFVVPAITYYDLGPKAAIKKSVETLKKTWGESIIRYFGMGLMRFLFGLIGLIVFGGLSLLFFIWVPVMWLGITFAILGVIYLILLNLVFNVANMVYNTALFVYADTGSVPAGWKKNVLANTFKPKPVQAGR
ncbi:MAG: hypothetical protein JW776_15745 [Candidatus Lokiarchaeota archaeon]|nr:hypothetical protein [Candidatus Lokiarchaeota archaeon]